MDDQISVIIPTYNRVGYLLEALDSVFAQTHKNLEVIVVDDGSVDNTPELMRAYPRPIKYIRQENRGLPAARNRGIAAATSEFLAFLDNDDLWEADKLEVQLKVLKENPDAALVYSRLTFVDEHLQPLERRFDGPCYEGYILEQLFQDCFIQVSTVLMRKACIDAVGGFNETFKAVEDYEFWFRVCARFPVKFIDRSLMYYRRHSSNMSSNALNMNLNNIQVLETAAEKHLFLRSAAPKRLEPYYADVGLEYFYHNDIPKARHYLWKSFLIRPWGGQKICFLVLSLLGQNIVMALKAVRRKWQG